MEVEQIISQECILERVNEQIVDVMVPQIYEGIVMSQERTTETFCGFACSAKYEGAGAQVRPGTD